jgi:hypothetical protein
LYPIIYQGDITIKVINMSCNLSAVLEAKNYKKKHYEKRLFCILRSYESSREKISYPNIALICCYSGQFHCFTGECVRFPDSNCASSLKELPDSKLLIRSHGHLSRICKTSY